MRLRSRAWAGTHTTRAFWRASSFLRRPDRQPRVMPPAGVRPWDVTIPAGAYRRKPSRRRSRASRSAPRPLRRRVETGPEPDRERGAPDRRKDSRRGSYRRTQPPAERLDSACGLSGSPARSPRTELVGRGLTRHPVRDHGIKLLGGRGEPRSGVLTYSREFQDAPSRLVANNESFTAALKLQFVSRPGSQLFPYGFGDGDLALSCNACPQRITMPIGNGHTANIIRRGCASQALQLS
jgi:hypothetical protein